MDKDLKKDLIADAALSCFLSTGYGGTSVDDIVKASGMSKGGIYWHFKSKEEIFLYLAQKWLNDSERELQDLLTGNYSAVEKLVRLKEKFLETINGPVSAIIYEFNLQAKDELKLKRLHALIKESKRKTIIKDYILLAIRRGEFRPLDAEAAAEVLIGIFEGISLQWFIQQKDRTKQERTANMSLDIFFNGVLAK
jgi:AcrR family transcriptional regulator